MSARLHQVADWGQALLSGAAQLGLSIGTDELEAYRAHLRLLLAHNRRAGLTTITDPVEIAIKHFLDSLSVLLVREIAAGEKVADIGSGGGFPGLVLAVARPEARFALVESVGKRAGFLELAAREIGLSNVSVVRMRSEVAGRDPAHREGHDLVVSRAVAPLPVLLEYCLPLARVGGQMVAYKGPEAEHEIGHARAALGTLGGRVVETHHLSLPREMGERRLVVIEKVAPTPERYPRRVGAPAKRPL